MQVLRRSPWQTGIILIRYFQTPRENFIQNGTARISLISFKREPRPPAPPVLGRRRVTARRAPVRFRRRDVFLEPLLQVMLFLIPSLAPCAPCGRNIMDIPRTRSLTVLQLRTRGIIPITFLLLHISSRISWRN